jgi:hypothetical protein
MGSFQTQSRAPCDFVGAGRGAPVNMVCIVVGVRECFRTCGCELFSARGGVGSWAIGVVAAVSGGTGEGVGRLTEGIQVTDCAAWGCASESRGRSTTSNGG